MQGTNDNLSRGTSTGTVKRKENTWALKELDSAGWAIGLTLERQQRQFGWRGWRELKSEGLEDSAGLMKDFGLYCNEESSESLLHVIAV